MDDDFGAFAQAHWRALWRAGWLLCGDAQRAEDLVQQTLERVWPQRHKLTTDDERRAYTYRVLTNGYLRERRRHWRGETPTASVPDAAVVEDDPATRVVLRAALDPLPERQRLAVVLRYFADQTEAQTAAAMNCSVSTVKTHVRRALETLRTSELLRDVAAEEAAT